MSTLIKLRRGLSSESSKSQFPDFSVIPSTYLLLDGEPCYEVDTEKLKIGDGVTRYSSLKYVGEGLVNVDGVSIEWTEQNTLSLKGFSKSTIISGSVPLVVVDTETGNKTLSYTSFSIIDLEHRVEVLETQVDELNKMKLIIKEDLSTGASDDYVLEFKDFKLETS